HDDRGAIADRSRTAADYQRCGWRRTGRRLVCGRRPGMADERRNPEARRRRPTPELVEADSTHRLRRSTRPRARLVVVTGVEHDAVRLNPDRIPTAVFTCAWAPFVTSANHDVTKITKRTQSLVTS